MCPSTTNPSDESRRLSSRPDSARPLVLLCCGRSRSQLCAKILKTPVLSLFPRGSTSPDNAASHNLLLWRCVKSRKLMYFGTSKGGLSTPPRSRSTGQWPRGNCERRAVCVITGIVGGSDATRACRGLRDARRSTAAVCRGRTTSNAAAARSRATTAAGDQSAEARAAAALAVATHPPTSSPWARTIAVGARRVLRVHLLVVLCTKVLKVPEMLRISGACGGSRRDWCVCVVLVHARGRGGVELRGAGR